MIRGATASARSTPCRAAWLKGVSVREYRDRGRGTGRRAQIRTSGSPSCTGCRICFA